MDDGLQGMKRMSQRRSWSCRGGEWESDGESRRRFVGGDGRMKLGREDPVETNEDGVVSFDRLGKALIV